MLFRSGANVGSYSVTVAYQLSNGTNGGLAANYSLAAGSATGAVTPRALSITAPTIASRVYDGTTAAGVVTVGSLSNLVGSETLGVVGSASTYSGANVGSYAVTIAYQLSNGTNGGLAANYSLAAGAATGAVTPRALSITAPTIASRVYDGTTAPGAVTVDRKSTRLNSSHSSVSRMPSSA